jgi:hypothetical protein
LKITIEIDNEDIIDLLEQMINLVEEYMEENNEPSPAENNR